MRKIHIKINSSFYFCAEKFADNEQMLQDIEWERTITITLSYAVLTHKVATGLIIET